MANTQVADRAAFQVSKSRGPNLQLFAFSNMAHQRLTSPGNSSSFLPLFASGVAQMTRRTRLRRDTTKSVVRAILEHRGVHRELSDLSDEVVQTHGNVGHHVHGACSSGSLSPRPHYSGTATATATAAQMTLLKKQPGTSSVCTPMQRTLLDGTDDLIHTLKHWHAEDLLVHSRKDPLSHCHTNNLFIGSHPRCSRVECPSPVPPVPTSLVESCLYCLKDRRCHSTKVDLSTSHGLLSPPARRTMK